MIYTIILLDVHIFHVFQVQNLTQSFVAFNTNINIKDSPDASLQIAIVANCNYIMQCYYRQTQTQLHAIAIINRIILFINKLILHILLVLLIIKLVHEVKCKKKQKTEKIKQNGKAYFQGSPMSPSQKAGPQRHPNFCHLHVRPNGLSQSDEIQCGNTWDRSVFLGVSHAPFSKGGAPVSPILGPLANTRVVRPIDQIWYSNTDGAGTCFLRSTTPPSQGGGPQRPPNFRDLLHARTQYIETQPNFAW